MEKIVFDRLGLTITFRCNMRCKLCAAYVPYRANPLPHYSLEMIQKMVSRYFRIIDYSNRFTVSGGEPFLHKELPEILDYIRRYKAKYGRLELITNGTIIPDTRLLDSLKNTECLVYVDDYGVLSKNALAVIEILEKNGISFIRRDHTPENPHFGGWINLIDFNAVPRQNEESERLFKRCIYANELRCHPVVGGKIYLCFAQEYCIYKGITKEDPRYYIDLLDDTLSDEMQRKKVSEFLKIDHALSCCNYCNGFCKDSIRYIPAEQL